MKVAKGRVRRRTSTFRTRPTKIAALPDVAISSIPERKLSAVAAPLSEARADYETDLDTYRLALGMIA